jgi:signal transduction histidine kinase
MNLVTMWSLAETGYALAGCAALAVSRCIWQRAPRGRETAFLSGSVLMLGMHYGCLAADAFRHARQSSAAPFTAWAAFGHLALILSGISFVAFLLIAVIRVSAPARPTRPLVETVVLSIVFASGLSVWLGGRLVVALLDGAAPDLIEGQVHAIVGSFGGGLAALCFMGPMGCLGTMFQHLPTRGGPRWTRWLSGGEGSHDRPSPRPRSSTDAARATRMHRLRLFALVFLWGAWCVSTPTLRFSSVWTPLSVGGAVVLRVLLLPGLLAFVHEVAPFLFFDVLVKRGVTWTAFAALVTMSTFTLAGPLMPDHANPLLGLACVGGTLLVGASVSLVDRGNQWLDGVLFHRADYRAALPPITAAMATAPDAEALTTTVTTHLTTALRAEFVRFSPNPNDLGPTEVRVGNSHRLRGYLALGPRARGQQYGSEDLTFVDAVAAQFAAHLEAFEARALAQLAAAAELRALRAQINPHFLFNALNTLADMAQGQPTTERTILNLSRVFRYALDSTQREHVPLRTELEAVRAYLEIEAERFDDRLRFAITVPDDLLETPVPPMLLQPLVENAVTHGLSSKVGGGTVQIDAVRTHGQLRLTVHDNGVGFDVEHTPVRVGLANVGARVERMGGTWRVQSIPGAGTRITVLLVTP